MTQSIEGQSGAFECNVCADRHYSHTAMRGDGRRVLFCASCGMGMIENPPADTSVFYQDGYYGGEAHLEVGYADYAFTAEHALLWARLLVQALIDSGRVLDVGCADGFMLRGLGPAYETYGIEVNAHAAERARQGGVTIIGNDVLADLRHDQFRRHFDVITSIATFEHVLDLRGAFHACLEALKPEGVLIFEIPLMSQTRDNKDWLEGSYEHIYYPTIRGIETLLGSFPGYTFTGFESDIKGYSSTYIGALASDPGTFARVEHLFRCMRQEVPAGLTDQESNVNVAYHVVHSFRPSPERILALPPLIEKTGSPRLLTHLMQLWYADCTAATNAEWYKTQAANWKASFDNLQDVHSKQTRYLQALEESKKTDE
ncbi:class I SAM-dependent methyltransferase [Cupriavidus nantongensis]|uniref:class I SAM-dependent methyltransferase n=1 Tax=Cupriavidus nantongensis TaxID=1796606 RepID=UPI00358F55D0